MLLVAENEAGYFGVNHKPARPKPYQANVILVFYFSTFINS